MEHHNAKEGCETTMAKRHKGGDANEYGKCNWNHDSDEALSELVTLVPVVEAASDPRMSGRYVLRPRINLVIRNPFGDTVP